MSLIGEALKRARQEAAYQEAAKDGRTWGPPPVYPAPRERAWPLIAVGVTAGALLVAAVGGGLYWLLGRDGREAARIERQAEEHPAEEQQAGGGETGAASPAAPSPAVIEELSPQGPAGTEANPPSLDRTGQEVLPAPRTGTPVAGAPGTVAGPDRTGEAAGTPGLWVRRLPPIVASPVPSPPATAPAGPPPQPPAQLEPRPVAPPPASTEPQSYVGEAPLPGGGKLELGGIADSADQPVALINGRVMGPGETIEGYTLVKIEEGRVVLQGRAGTIYLSLR